MEQSIWSLLATILDPEVPVLSIVDLGVVRRLVITPEGELEAVIITPTYSGCPAMNTIEMEIRAVLDVNGFRKAKVQTVLSPAWTTDWLTEGGRQKLLDYGIAPPSRASFDKNTLFGGEARQVGCPRCASMQTEMVSQFGSTACKALYRCLDCLEPFDYFKCI